MSIRAVDRKPTRPGRRLIKPESGASFYAVIERADEPTVEGTLITAAFLNDVIDQVADVIDKMTVAANQLEEGEPATAVISNVSGHKHIQFGLPRGRQGERGQDYFPNATLTMDDISGEIILKIPDVPEISIDYAYDDETSELFMRVHGH